ncbi:MAG: hypothetical protein J6V44_15750 [Methanobrevibacter sp.]|nr:hypothetical protein [Methanobrevibacter sp.]
MDDSKPKRNKGIVQIEKRITELVEMDIMNEEIYVLLKKLAHIYINQNKFVYGYSGVEDVCHDVASDVWLAVINGRVIKSWMYYIGKMIKMSYVANQRRIEHEVINTEYDPSYKYNIKVMCTGSSMSCIKDFDNMERNLVLDNVAGMILKTMSKTKFKPGTKEYLDLYTNVCINLVRELDNEDYIYFRIDNHIKPYVQIVIEQFKKDFRNSGFTESIADNVDDDLEMLITSDEALMKELKKG